jgi:hypothetical protein
MLILWQLQEGIQATVDELGFGQDLGRAKDWMHGMTMMMMM